MANHSGNSQKPRRVSRTSRVEWWILGAALVASVALIVMALMAPHLARADDAPKADAAKAAKVPTEIPKLDGIWVLDKEHSDDPSKLRPAGMHGGGGGGSWGGHGGGGMGGMGGGGSWGGGGGHHRGGGGGSWGGGGSSGEGGPPEGEGGGAPEGGPPSGGEHSRPNPQPDKLVIYRDGEAFNVDDGAGHSRELTWTADAADTGGVVPAHWDGKKLVADMKSERGSRSITYDLDKDGKALTVTMHMQRPDGESVSLKSRYTKYQGTEE